MLLTATCTLALVLPSGPVWEQWMGPDCEHARTAFVLLIASVLVHCGVTLVILAVLAALLPVQRQCTGATESSEV